MEKLTNQEEQAMQAIWRVGEGHVKLFLEQINDEKLRYTTLASTVKNLEKKGYLTSRLVGNVYLYKPVIDEDEYKKKFMSGVVQNYFANSYKDLVNFFVEQKKLSADELKEIIDLIEEKNKKWYHAANLFLLSAQTKYCLGYGLFVLPSGFAKPYLL